ncbi:hypothetical protein ABT317_38675, partial [Streptomyces carpinensis]
MPAAPPRTVPRGARTRTARTGGAGAHGTRPRTTADPAAKGPKIDKTMYGVFFEDINRAADGGLYA